MKRWICGLLTAFLLPAILSPLAVSAASGGEPVVSVTGGELAVTASVGGELVATGGELVVSAATGGELAASGGELALKGKDVTVTLYRPEGVTEAVTSLRFWLYVTVTQGEMAQPVFQFADAASEEAIPGVVKDAAVTKQGSRYIVDLIVAAKQEQDIFKGADRAVIGILSMQPSSQQVQAEIGAASEAGAEESQPVMKYISASSQAEQTALLANISPVTYSGSVSDLPTVPNVEPDAEFEKAAVPKLKLQAKNTTRRVDFSWKQISGADGYKIYQYQEDTGKFKRIKTISKADKTSYSKKLAFGTSYQFRMRAFQIQPDGTKVYGAYSTIKKVSTAPAKVKGLAVRRQGTKAVISWKQTEPADGYQVFQSERKQGAYTRMKTIKKGDVCHCTVKGLTGTKTFYKVRAYVVKANGKRKCGAFSSVKAAG